MTAINSINIRISRNIRFAVLNRRVRARAIEQTGAEQSDPDGQFFMGMMYCRGLRFPESSSNNVFSLRYLPYTHMWLSLAAAQGDERVEFSEMWLRETRLLHRFKKQ